MQDPAPLNAGNLIRNGQIGLDKAVVQHLPVAVYTCDANGIITFYNRAAAELWGREPQAGVDKWSGACQAYSSNGDIMPKNYKFMAETMATGRIGSPVELIIERPDTSLAYVLMQLSLIYDENNTVNGATIILTDSNANRRAEELAQKKLEKKIEENRTAVRKTEERYHKMIGEVQDYAIVLLDSDGNILNWNKGAQKIKGYTEAEALGRNFRIFYLPEDRENKLPEALINNARMNGRATNEGWRMRKDGTKFWGSVVITALHDDDNTTIGFSKVTRDLTERKFAEDRLRNNARDIEFRNKQLEEYAYIASHDLQEPLRKIQVFSEMLVNNIDTREAALHYIEKITASAGRMTTLIKDVLKYSQLQSTDELFEVTHLNAILENVLEDFDLIIEQKNVTLNVENLPVVYGIPIQLHQLFSNLLSNAIKFSTKDPIISISCEPSTLHDAAENTFLKSGVPYTKILFKDNGQGFEQEYADMVFKMFKRLDNTPGTGIGLALCKKIVENHKGSISVKSEPGVGSEFSIFLPLV